MFVRQLLQCQRKSNIIMDAITTILSGTLAILAFFALFTLFPVFMTIMTLFVLSILLIAFMT
jgi:hypothetical protein